MSGRFIAVLPNRMPYTNPGAISNSGNKYFTNPKSKISKLNMGILDNANAIENYQSAISSEQINTNSNTNTFTNVGLDFKSILAEQNNNSRTNKLYQSNEYNDSSTFQF